MPLKENSRDKRGKSNTLIYSYNITIRTDSHHIQSRSKQLSFKLKKGITNVIMDNNKAKLSVKTGKIWNRPTHRK